MVIVSGPVEQFFAVPLRSIGWPAQAWPGHSKVNSTHGFGAQLVVQFLFTCVELPQELEPTALAVCASPSAVHAPMVKVRLRWTEAPAATLLTTNGWPSIVIVMSSTSTEQFLA